MARTYMILGNERRTYNSDGTVTVENIKGVGVVSRNIPKKGKPAKGSKGKKGNKKHR